MAYVPDEAIERMSEVSGNAFKLFNFYCSKADRMGKSFHKPDSIARETGWKRNHIYEHRKALTDANWIAADGDHVTVLIGFPRPSGKSENGTKSSPKIVPNQPENESDFSPKIVPNKSENRTKSSPKTGLKEELEVLKRDLFSPKTGLDKSENGTKSSPKIVPPYKEEPAQLTSPINQPNQPQGEDAKKSANGSVEEINWEYDQFCAAYESNYELPYAELGGKKDKGRLSADFVQLARLRNRARDKLTPERWAIALKNYFATPQQSHTLADLSARFDSFQKSAFDRFNKPIALNGSQRSQVEETDEFIRNYGKSGTNSNATH
jgi:hypothetical protein